MRLWRRQSWLPSDGITTDIADWAYIADPDESAIVRIDPDGSLTTFIKSERLRWADGIGFGPDGWLYVTCSSLHHVFFRSRQHVRKHVPYHIFRFRPGGAGEIPGH